MYIGKILRLIRTNKGIRQGEMATILGISQNFLSLVESNKKNLSPDKIEEISKKLNISKEALLISASNTPSELTEEQANKFKTIQRNLLSMILLESHTSKDAHETA